MTSKVLNGKPRIGVMIGDPCGVSPEICAKALATREPQEFGNIVLVGNLHVVEDIVDKLAIDADVRAVESADGAADEDFIPVIDCGDLRREDYEMGVSSAAGGLAAKQWIDHADALCKSGDLDGWVMAPVNVTSLRMAGKMVDIDDLQPPDTWLLRLSGPLRIVPIAEHLLISDVTASVTPERILTVLRLLVKNLKLWGMEEPRIGVAGLNPHAMFPFDEEVIGSAVAQGVEEGFDVKGPIAPDAVFRHCIEDKYDAVISMYHDQGQIALKTAAFAGACTVFMGLGYPYLSVPHGTAYDIAGKGIAQHYSVQAAMKTASQLAAGTAFAEKNKETLIGASESVFTGINIG